MSKTYCKAEKKKQKKMRRDAKYTCGECGGSARKKDNLCTAKKNRS